MDRIICVVGPTASGKTKLAVQLAKAYDGEVVSCDSMQIYKHMDIGTAKPTPEEMEGVPHHMIDCVEPGEDFSVGKYVQLADGCVQDILSRGKAAVIAGGTGLYVDSLIAGRTFAPVPQTGKREALEAQLRQEGGEAMLRKLRAVDPDAAARLHPADEKRIPARQDDADAVHAATRPGRLPLRRCFVAVFADQLLNALAHLGRDVRTAVHHAVYRSARYAALIRDPLCSYLHSRILPFTLSCIFLFTARNHGKLCILVHVCTVYSIIPNKASQAILCILDTAREFVAFGCAFFVFAQRTAFLHVFARDFLHFSPNRHAKIGRYAKNEIPT